MAAEYWRLCFVMRMELICNNLIVDHIGIIKTED